MKKKFGRLNQAGISLLEVLLSLGIIAIILSFAVQYFLLSSNHQKLNIVRNFVGADMAAIQSYGINNSGFDNLSWDALFQNGYISENKGITCTGGANTNCSQKTPWGDDVTITSLGGLITLTVPLPNNELCNNFQQSYGKNIVACDTVHGASATIYVNGLPTSA